MNAPSFSLAPIPGELDSDSVFVNLSGDYGYLSDGYYRSMEAEHEGKIALPSPADALDAYVVPLALAKAKAAGLAIPDWEIGNDDTVSFDPPLIAYPVNPFQSQGIVATDEPTTEETIKSLTMGGKYALVLQDMPKDSRVDTMRMVIGRCLKPEYAELAAQVWTIFRVPLARVKVIVTRDQYLFSAIEPLPREELTQNEKAILKDASLWRW